MTFADQLLSKISFVQYLEFFLRIIVASACGAVIGIERSKRMKEAGVRTHVIVCVAACLVMIVSKYGFCDLALDDGTTLMGTKGTDPARLAAQVITGISFLGAGIIFHNGTSVKGLTTAAGVWATMGIGVTLGAGMYILGVFVTIVVAILQIVMHKFQIGTDSMDTVKIHFIAKDSKEFREAFEKHMQTKGIQVIDSSIHFTNTGYVNYAMTIRIHQDTVTTDSLKTYLEDNAEDIKEISISTMG